MLTQQQLLELRKQIVLNSLYTSDYNNTFDIPPQDVQLFFDSYIEDMWDLWKYEQESNPQNYAQDYFTNTQNFWDYFVNNNDNLIDYYNSIEDPLF